MESFIKQCGDKPIEIAMETNTMECYKESMILKCKRAKIINIKQLFNQIIADDASWIDTSLYKKLINVDFLKQWKEEILIKTKEIKTDEIKATVVTIPKYQIIKDAFQPNDFNEEHLKHLPMYQKKQPSAQITDILKPIFEKYGFTFNMSEWELLWNILLSFPNIQAILLNQYDIIPIEGQLKSPKHINGLGGLKDFLAMDILYPKLKKKWGETIGFNSFSFIGRPWKFKIGNLLFEETDDPNKNLFEQLLLFCHKEQEQLKFPINHSLFQFDSKPKTINLLCYYLCLSTLFGKQISMDLQPTVYYTYTANIPPCQKYFLSLANQPIAISLDCFRCNEIFGGVNIDPLAHPFPKKTYVWIQMEHDGNNFKMFVFPKHITNSLPFPIANNDVFQPPDLLKQKIIHGKNEIIFQVLKHGEDILYTVNTVNGPIYKTVIKEEEEKSYPKIWICFLETNRDLNKIAYLSKIWNIQGKKNLIISHDHYYGNDNDIYMNLKMAIQEWKNIHKEIAFVFMMDTSTSFHYFEPVPLNGYIIISSIINQEQINWNGIQSLYSKRNTFLKSIPCAKAILDKCALYVKISNFTLEREEQTKEYTNLTKRPCEKSILLKQLWKKTKTF